MLRPIHPAKRLGANCGRDLKRHEFLRLRAVRQQTPGGPVPSCPVRDPREQSHPVRSRAPPIQATPPAPRLVCDRRPRRSPANAGIPDRSRFPPPAPGPRSHASNDARTEERHAASQADSRVLRPSRECARCGPCHAPDRSRRPNPKHTLIRQARSPARPDEKRCRRISRSFARRKTTRPSSTACVAQRDGPTRKRRANHRDSPWAGRRTRRTGSRRAPRPRR